MRRLWPAPALVLALAFALPAPAAALDQLGGPANVLRNRVVVDGQDVFYLRWEKREEGFDVIRARPGSATRLPGVPFPGSNISIFTEEFDASSQRYALAWGYYEQDDAEESNSYEWRTARVGEPLAQLGECFGRMPTVAVDDDAVALQPSECGLGGDLTVFDQAPGAAVPQRTIDHPSNLDGEGSLRLAGRYVAFVVGARSARARNSARQVVVYDWVAGAEVYRASASVELPLPGDFRFDHFDLQADGKLVAASAPRVDDPDDDAKPPCEDSIAVVWWSPAEPQPHVLAQKACDPRIRIGNDRLAFLRRAGDTGAELVTTGLTGGPVTPVATFAHEGSVHALDFDGARAAFAVRGCVHPTVYAEVAQPATPASFAQPNCPVTIAKSAGRVTRGGFANLRFTCPNGCRELDMAVTSPFKASDDARIGVGKTYTARVRLPAGLRARLARGGRVQLKVAASHSTFDAVSSYNVFPRRQSFSRTVTVLPR
jgi:hypothetical protein